MIDKEFILDDSWHWDRFRYNSPVEERKLLNHVFDLGDYFSGSRQKTGNGNLSY